jgi:hypothetical protein
MEAASGHGFRLRAAERPSGMTYTYYLTAGQRVSEVAIINWVLAR